MPQAQQVIVCDQACTVTVQHEITLPVLNLGMEEAGMISSAILLVWAVGYGFRALIRVLNVDGATTSERDET